MGEGAIATRRRVLVLQHPQEPHERRNSAPLLAEGLERATLRVGLSWPNLKRALGDDTAVPSRWLVLYLGSGVHAPPGWSAPPGTLVPVDKKGVPVPDPGAVLREIDGIVALDGTWSQAKALWWRNAWLLKLRRAILVPRGPSRYGRLRREPRAEATSTLEAVATALTALGEPPEVEVALLERFDAFVAAERARGRSG